MKVRWAIWVLIVAIIVMATGCGEGSTDPSVTADQSTAATTTEPVIATSTKSTAAPSTEAPPETTTASTEPTPVPAPDWFEFSVGDLVFDEAGTLWAAGHLERGEEGLRDLYRLDGTEWQIVENSRVFSLPVRWELRAAPGGGIFVGADGGVYRTDGKNWELFEEEFACGSLAVDSTGLLWATCPDFLTRLVDGAWDDVPEGWAAQSVATGADGSVWFTTFTWPGFELLRFDGVGWTSIAPCEDCYGPRSILGIDETGGAWVARGECGLDGLTRFDPSGSSGDFDIRGAGDLAFGLDGSMWFAIPCTQTLGDGGVARYLDGEWRLYTTDDGLPSNNVQAVETAPDGTIFIGTDKGVSTYDPETDMMTTSLQTNVFSFIEDDLCQWISGDVVSEIVVDAYRRYGATPIPSEFEERWENGTYSGCTWTGGGSDTEGDYNVEVGLLRADARSNDERDYTPHPALSPGVQVGPMVDLVGSYDEWMPGIEVRLMIESQDYTVEFWHGVPPGFDGDVDALLAIADGLLRQMRWVTD